MWVVWFFFFVLLFVFNFNLKILINSVAYIAIPHFSHCHSNLCLLVYSYSSSSQTAHLNANWRHFYGYFEIEFRNGIFFSFLFSSFLSQKKKKMYPNSFLCIYIDSNVIFMLMLQRAQIVMGILFPRQSIKSKWWNHNRYVIIYR